MSRTTNWAVDKLKNADKVAKTYYTTFNQIYYKHKKPTEDDCKVLGITMERAIELRKEGYKIENRQRADAANWADRYEPRQFEDQTFNRRVEGDFIESDDLEPSTDEGC